MRKITVDIKSIEVAWRFITICLFAWDEDIVSMDNPRRLANFLMRSRFGAELWHRCKVRNIAKVSAAILSIERVSGALGFGMAFTVRYFRWIGVSLGLLRRERSRKRVTSPNTLRIDSSTQRLKLSPDYYPVIRLPASPTSNFCERAKLESTTRMTERKGERLCLGILT